MHIIIRMPFLPFALDAGSFLHLLICRPGRVNVNGKPTVEVATVGVTLEGHTR
jgi:hypothetical protein